jgi:hypothetical protein
MDGQQAATVALCVMNDQTAEPDTVKFYESSLNNTIRDGRAFLDMPGFNWRTLNIIVMTLIH